MKIINWAELKPEGRELFLDELRAGYESKSLREETSAILQELRNEGEAALRKFSLRFDGVELGNFCIGLEELERSSAGLSNEESKALEIAYANILAFHQRQLDGLHFEMETMPGVSCERITRPIEPVGLYVPGGSAPLVSSLLMMAIPAKLAGCQEIMLCTPPQKDGSLHPAIAFGARLCGLERVFLLGGAQAIGAMAYGIGPMPKAHKIFGPGNRYVTQAKILVSEEAHGPSMDLPAGPSEVLVVADENASPSIVAADLLSQAEHDPDARVVCLFTDEGLGPRIREEVCAQLKTLPRGEIAAKAIDKSCLLECSGIESALEISNRMAPEHLILNVNNPRSYLGRIRSAGSIFLGSWTPESFGDYASGTNHVLPTNGFAQAVSGLGVKDFLKEISVQECSPGGFENLSGTVETLARLEGLEAHARAVEIRRDALATEGLPQEEVDPKDWVLSLVQPHLRQYKAYESARSFSGESSGLYLDANENPYAPLVGKEGQEKLNRYPEPQGPRLISRLSDFYDLSLDQVLACRGSDEAIDLLVRCFCRPGLDQVLSFSPSFGYYQCCASIQNINFLKSPLKPENDFRPDWGHLKSLLAENTVKLIFLCSPNNPTGTSLDRAGLEDLLKFSKKRFLVVVDEAYIEFSSQSSCVDLLDEFENLVILRTFSKAMGLAGLRFGTALSSPEVIEVLRKVHCPYPIPSNVIGTLLEFLKPGPLQVQYKRIEEIIRERARVSSQLLTSDSVLKVYASEANFLLVEMARPEEFLKKAREFGIRVRDRSAEIPGCCRISLGTPLENDTLLSLLGIETSEQGPCRSSLRVGEVSRRTTETSIVLRVEIHSEASSKIQSGVEFLDHMLEQVSRHGGFGLDLNCEGDLEVDDHHSVEDCALALGQALNQALGDRKGIKRYGFSLPMDEALARVSLDLSGRPAFVKNGDFGTGRLGGVNLEMVPHFFESFCQALGCALHIEVYGENSHHKVEAAFKGLGKTLAQAFEIEGDQVPSTKGIL